MASFSSSSTSSLFFGFFIMFLCTVDKDDDGKEKTCKYVLANDTNQKETGKQLYNKKCWLKLEKEFGGVRDSAG